MKVIAHNSSQNSSLDLSLKKDTRKIMLSRRKSLFSEYVDNKSAIICKNLCEIMDLKKQQNIALYCPFQNEVNVNLFTDFLLKNNKNIFLPKFDKCEKDYFLAQIFSRDKDLSTGKYGVKEPRVGLHSLTRLESDTIIDLWIIPGLAFDLKCNRLGMGKGYYDDFLKNVVGYKLAVAYEWQIVKHLEVTSLDIKMDMILTEKGKIINECLG